MRIKEISVECKFLKALPNYQNVTFTAGSVASVSENEDVKECYEQLWEMCGEQVNEQLRLFSEVNKK